MTSNSGNRSVISIAEKKGEEELKDTFEHISMVEVTMILHACTIEKIVNHN